MINKSLSALALVVSKLGEVSKSRGKRASSLCRREEIAMRDRMRAYASVSTPSTRVTQCFHRVGCQ